MSQNKIESILNETRRFEPPERFVSNSQLTNQSLARLKQKALDSERIGFCSISGRFETAAISCMEFAKIVAVY